MAFISNVLFVILSFFFVPGIYITDNYAQE
jgi:hypothetical protein